MGPALGRAVRCEPRAGRARRGAGSDGPAGGSGLQRLAGELPTVRDVLGELGEETLRREIQGLAHEHLVQAEPCANGPAYSCHRILRDHFRSALLAQDRAVAAEVERAGDDDDGALALACQCGYAWAERDALTLAADVRQALGDANGALGLRHEADALSARLRSPE